MGAPAREGIHRLSLVDSVEARLLKLIHSGELTPGERLPSERVLAQNLGVSRNLLRETLRTLESVGLIEARRGSGWYVRGERPVSGLPQPLVSWMKVQPIGDVLQLRRMLEPEALLAVPAVSVAGLAEQLRAKFDEMEVAFTNEDHRAASALHSQFHRTLVQYAPAALLKDLLAVAIESANSAQLQVFGTPRAGEHSLRKHEWIVEQLEVGDVAGAAKKLREHLEPEFTFPAES